MFEFNLRRATGRDVVQTYAWAQNPNVRKYSFSKKKISWEEHHMWFFKVLDSENCEYLILEENQQVCGSIKFDITGETAEINYLVDPEFKGRGLGTYLIKRGIYLLKELRPEVNEVYGSVLRGNAASIKIFYKTGFSVVDHNPEYFKFKKLLK